MNALSKRKAWTLAGGALGLALQIGPVETAIAQSVCPDLADYPVYALTSDNAIYRLSNVASGLFCRVPDD